jgi:hypothetical protein
MPRIWDELESRGWRLQRTFFDHLRSLQVPDPSVQPSEVYFAERIRERMSIFRGFWTVNRRPGKSLSYRSPYLDLLEERLAAGAWPELGKARERSIKTLDPAEMRYLELPLVDGGRRWLELVSEYRAQAVSEALALPERYRDEWGAKAPTSASSATRLMRVILETIGFSLEGRNPGGSVIFVRALGTDELKMYCSLSDPLQMKRGSWSLGIGFCHPDDSLDRLSYDAILIAAGFTFWLPGGDWYLRHEGSPSRAVLGIVVCAALLELLCNEFDRSVPS